jgi:hypothetical protein
LYYKSLKNKLSDYKDQLVLLHSLVDTEDLKKSFSSLIRQKKLKDQLNKIFYNNVDIQPASKKVFRKKPQENLTEKIVTSEIVNDFYIEQQDFVESYSREQDQLHEYQAVVDKIKFKSLKSVLNNIKEKIHNERPTDVLDSKVHNIQVDRISLNRILLDKNKKT